MRSHKERVDKVRRQIDASERQKSRRRSQMLIVTSTVVSLFVIVGLSVCMPDIVRKVTRGSYGDLEMAASIFSNSEVIGYIIVGLISFLLGICVTILCFRARKLQQENREVDTDGGDHR